MSLVVSQTGPGGRVGELALWSAAGLIVLTTHIGAAFYLMNRAPEAPSDNSPPAAIMIELAPEPEAANTEEEQITPDMVEQEEKLTEQTEPVETPPEPVEQAQPDPEPQPVPEPVEAPQEVAEPPPVEPPPPEVAEIPEPTPPEPVIEEPPPEPEPQVTETIPEPPPEPIEPPPVDPIKEQMTAALENVEVPLPSVRPLPPPVAEKPPEEKKPEPKKEQPKRVQPKPKQQQPQAQQERAEAKVQTKESDRTAADRTSTGFFSQSVTPAQWRTRVEAKLKRAIRRCPVENNGTVAVRFSFDGGGNVTGVSLTRSSGDQKNDDYILSAVRRASPIPAPPPGAENSLVQALTCLRG